MRLFRLRLLVCTHISDLRGCGVGGLQNHGRRREAGPYPGGPPLNPKPYPGGPPLARSGVWGLCKIGWHADLPRKGLDPGDLKNKHSYRLPSLGADGRRG
jgi:hypothetical protein